jgi:hypothetical protein
MATGRIRRNLALQDRIPMAVIDFVGGVWLPLFSRGVHVNWAAVTGLAHHLALNFVQVPLDLKRYETLALVGILPFCIVKQRSHSLELARELLTNCRVGAIEPGYIHLGLSDAVTERGQFCPVRHGHLHR